MNPKLRTVLIFLLSAGISYTVFYFFTSEFVYRVYSGSYTFMVPLIIALFIGQTSLIFMIFRLLMDHQLDRWNVIILWIIYAFVMAVLLFGRPAADYGASAVPSGFNRQYIIQVLLNMICFLPMGIAFRKLPEIRMAVISVLMILAVEIIQAVTHRGVFDVIDIIAGTLGIIAGYALTCFISTKVSG